MKFLSLLFTLICLNANAGFITQIEEGRIESSDLYDSVKGEYREFYLVAPGFKIDLSADKNLNHKLLYILAATKVSVSTDVYVEGNPYYGYSVPQAELKKMSPAHIYINDVFKKCNKELCGPNCNPMIMRSIVPICAERANIYHLGITK